MGKGAVGEPACEHPNRCLKYAAFALAISAIAALFSLPCVQGAGLSGAH